MNCIEIGKRLRALRGDKTMDEVADAIGVCRAAINMYELGARIPRDDIKLAISNYYGVSIDELFFSD